jgi:3-oxoacyl-[acyl-carrier protein] reductase
MNPERAVGSKVVLITGGSRGIGRATALLFAREGYDVAFSFHRGTDPARATAHAIEACGRHAFYRPIDAARADETAAFVTDARDELGRIDAVVANAGITGSLGWEGVSPEEWRSIFATNLEGQYFAVRAAAPDLKRTRGAAILVASIAGLTAQPEEVAYAAAKAGTISLARSLALALAPEVRVNAIAPGWVRTDMTAGLYDEPQARAAIVRGIPRGRWGEPEDVAAAALFLASDGARFVTGETLVVDGGNSLSWRIGRQR